MNFSKFKSAVFIFLILIVWGDKTIAQVMPGEELPPALPPKTMDSYGIDLISGSASLPGINVNIGTEESGISFSESGWNSGNINFDGRIVMENTADYYFPDIPVDADPAGYYLKVTTGSSSAKFKQQSAVNQLQPPFSLFKGRGSLSMPSSSTFLFIDGNGTEYLYDMQYAGQYGILKYPINQQLVAALTQIRKADGEIIDIRYKFIGRLNPAWFIDVDMYRFDSATSSLGWMIKYNAGWDLLPEHDKSVTAINSSVDFCSTTPGVCNALTKNWQTSTLEQQSIREEDASRAGAYNYSYVGTITNALSGVTTCQLPLD